MTNKKLTNRQAIGVLDGLWSNPLFGEAHRQAFEIGIKAIKALEQEPWIPVSEKLPECLMLKTLVSCENDDGLPVCSMIAVYDGFKQKWDCDYRVNAWMPLPEPYKAESEVRNETIHT